MSSIIKEMDKTKQNSDTDCKTDTINEQDET